MIHKAVCYSGPNPLVLNLHTPTRAVLPPNLIVSLPRLRHTYCVTPKSKSEYGCVMCVPQAHGSLPDSVAAAATASTVGLLRLGHGANHSSHQLCAAG